jgi:hypothetical protein
MFDPFTNVMAPLKLISGVAQVGIVTNYRGLRMKTMIHLKESTTLR